MRVLAAIRTGAMWNIAESASLGVRFSFRRSLTPSATFWRYPRPMWVGRSFRLKGQNGRDQMETMIPYRAWRRRPDGRPPEPFREPPKRRDHDRDREDDLVHDPDDRAGEDLACGEQVRDQRRAHLSISPTQTSMDPRIDTTSASLFPRSMRGVAAMEQKMGLRIFTR